MTTMDRTTEHRAEGERALVDLSPAEAKRMVDAGAVLIDVREPDEFARERIPGAVNVPLSRFSPAEVKETVRSRNAERAVLHCQAGVRSAQAAQAMLSAGDAVAHHVAGGLNAWRSAGLGTSVDRKQPISVMRQVQITVGLFVLLGTLAGAFVSPWLLIVPGFFGAGLLFAGVTGTCALAAVLAKMPWNRRPSSAAGAACCAP